ncbi:MAG: nitrous oxide reductase, partial [Flavobacteriaceae bacterium]|nr:nitrous oxide reductase [Flavobacteriaceae bacterium]
MKKIIHFIATFAFLVMLLSCSNPSQKSNNKQGALASNAAEKVYVAPGEYDEYYAFISGGFSGQLSVYGLPS